MPRTSIEAIKVLPFQYWSNGELIVAKEIGDELMAKGTTERGFPLGGLLKRVLTGLEAQGFIKVAATPDGRGVVISRCGQRGSYVFTN